MIGFQADEEQEQLLFAVRQLMEEEVVPLLVTMDQRGDDTFDWSLVKLLAERNLICPVIPTQYGGRGLSYLNTALIIEEIAAANPGLASIIATVIHAIIPLLLAGSEAQKSKYLPLLTSKGANLAAFALTEPSGGSDLEHMKALATPTTEGYLLEATKDYLINGAVSQFITLCARVKGVAGFAGLEFFILNPDQYQVTAIRNKLGIRYAHTVQITTQSELSLEQKIGEPGSGYLLLTQTLDYGRALVGALEVGIARAAYQMALTYSHERVQFGRPIFTNQGIAFPLAEMATSIDAARLLVWRACNLIDNTQDCSREASMAKLFASEVAQQTATKAAEIFGARGYTFDHPINILLRDAKAGGTVEGSNNIQRMVIASLL